MMKPALLFHPKPTQKLQTSRTMTIKGKKNSKVKIITNKKTHNYWGNIFRRKRIMSEYFSDSAFGSQSDTKIELPFAHLNPELAAKYRARLVIDAHNYNEEDSDNNLAIMGNPD